MNVGNAVMKGGVSFAWKAVLEPLLHDGGSNFNCPPFITGSGQELDLPQTTLGDAIY
jgi:hypothetical protein